MKISNREMQFELPPDLHQKLTSFRRRVWLVKLAEICFAVFSLATLCYLGVFILDRLGETPAWLRLSLLATATAGVLCGVPIKLYRWVWSRRRFDQLARLLAWSQPTVGDRLLGVVDLVQNQHRQHASPALCRAAIKQVADDTRAVDFQTAVPNPRHRTWAAVAGSCAVLGLGALLVPGAGLNALQRWLLPLSEIDRYTFTKLHDVPNDQVVAIGEPFEFQIELAGNTVWKKPRSATARYGDQPSVQGEWVDGRYRFQLPAQTEPDQLKLAIGDARHVISVRPMTRPELKSLSADIQLPAYLGHDDQRRDVRSGAVSVVKGSHAVFQAVASRPLSHATVNGDEDDVQLDGATLRTANLAIEVANEQEFRWTDIEGLSAKSPFKLRIRAVDDRAPSVQCSNLPNEKVILDEETLAFEVAAMDDFGVKSIGVEWQGVADPRRNPNPQSGEFLLAAGRQTADQLAIAGAISPQRLGISPQPIQVRVYSEDYLPGRERVYSPFFRLYVLDREQHMIWVTQQLERWERQALEVRDQEQQLLDTNRELSKLDPALLDNEATRQTIARQAAAERANAGRLAALTTAGEQLISEAARNAEFEVGTLERWAQVMKSLQQLAKNEMPSVANRLAAAANASKSGEPAAAPTAPSVSDTVRGMAEDPKEDEQDEAEPSDGSQSPPPGKSPLGLVQTTLQSKSKPKPSPPGESAANDVEQAVEEQAALLAEFNRVMDELKEVLQQLQGSTFVKRLKAAADAELQIAAGLHARIQDQFGDDKDSLSDEKRALLQRLYAVQADTTRDVRIIQEDISAFFERTRRESFKQVHQEMETTEVVRNFKGMTQLLEANYGGETIAQAEFWSDQLDRWAEILVGPASSSGGT